jgi:hypothetical protein
MLKVSVRLRAAVYVVVGGAALWAQGCKKPETDLGRDLQTEDDLLALYQNDTTTVGFATVREDSLATGNLSSSVLGNMYLPGTGWHTASFACQLRLSAPDVDFGTGAVPDSLYLRLRYTGALFGRQAPVRFDVRELAEPVRIDSTYYSTRLFATTGLNLVHPDQPALRFDPDAELQSGEDTLTGELRIRLDPVFAQRLMDAAAEGVFASNDAWLDYFDGLSVSLLPGSEGAAAFDLTGGLSGMRLHYHNAEDTLVYDFVLNALSGRANLFRHTWSEELAGLNAAEDEEVTDAGWVVSGAGAKLRIRLPHIASLNDFEGRAINRAELWLPLDSAALDARFPPPDQLFVLMEDADGLPISTPDQNAPGITINGNLDPATGYYRFNLTSTVQQWVNGTLGTDRLHVVASRAGISLQGVRILGPEGDGVSDRRTKLVLTYSH